MKRLILSLLAILLFANTSFSQVQEHIVKFIVQNKADIQTLPKYLSIDRVSGDTVIAYLPNDKTFSEFKKLYPKFIELPKPGSYLRKKAMATSVDDLISGWDLYPTYPVYVQYMQKIAHDYPYLCRLDTIGKSQNGRLLLVLKITDNPDKTEFKPQFFYTSTMHGDEVTGYMFLLRFIDYLLSNYGKDANVTWLVNNYEIYINPLANPDGTYAGGDDDISGAVRYYANGIDPNRNFEPQPGGYSADDPGYCPETEAMKVFASKHRFVMSANLHGGAEVYNYPWDVWTTSEHPHPDNDWFKAVASVFVDSARIYDANYFTDPYSSGYTEGADWYSIKGGRQDYMNFVQHCKEVTLEVSSSKMPSSSEMPTFFKYLLSPMFWYITETTNGIQGLVLDSDGKPLQRRIVLDGYDVVADSSFVLSRASDGAFFRPVQPGSYTVLVQDLSGNTEYSKDITTTSGRNFMFFAPQNLDSIQVCLKTLILNTNTSIPNTYVHIKGLTNTFDDTVITGDNGLTTLKLYPGIYKMTTNFDGFLFPITNFVEVYNGIDTILLEQFNYNNTQIKLSNFLTNQPIASANIQVTLNDKTLNKTTDAQGQANLQLIKSYTYKISISKTGYYDFDTTITANSDNQQIEINLKPIVQVKLYLIDSTQNQKISGAKIELYDIDKNLVNQYTTDDSGLVNFTLPQFDIYTAKIILDSLPNIYKTIKPECDSITDTIYVVPTFAELTVIDTINQQPVKQAVVEIFNDQSFYTDTTGKLFLKGSSVDPLPANVYATGYYSKKAQIQLSRDTARDTIYIYPKVYYNFTVLDSATGQPLAGVSVLLQLNDSQQLSYFTDTQGQVQITWPNYAPYLVSFSKTGYITKKFIFNPADENSIQIDKTIKLSSNLSDTNKNADNISVYPNPTQNIITISNSANYTLTITDLTGRILIRKKLEKDNESLNLSNFESGLYIILLEKNNEHYSTIVIKQ